MFLRRSVYAINRVALATNLTRSSVRAYATSTQGSHSYSNYETHNEIEVGDLVTYVESGNRTEGIVQKIFEESSNTNVRKPPHLAQVQNYYSRKVSYNDLSNLRSVARGNKDAPTAKASGAKATPATPNNNINNNKTASSPSSTAQKSATPSSSSSSSSSSAASRPPATTTASVQAQSPQHLSEAKDKINQQLKSEDSPLNADYAAGDIVRYRVAQNFTAGVILDIIYTNTHDEHGTGFHGASKENPMAKLENLWTKNITYHHLNVLEHVKRARDVTPGRFAESEFEVYNEKKNSSS